MRPIATRGQLSKRERQAIHAKTSGHCAYCGCDLPYARMQVDHIMPLANGGADETANMLPACRSCNHYKGTLTLERFRRCIEQWPDVLMRDSVTFRNAVRFRQVERTPHAVRFFFEDNTTGGHQP